MAQAEGEYSFECPYCSETVMIALDYTAGDSQKFTCDCEVCCRPVAIKLEIEEGEVTEFSAEQES